MSVKMSTAAEKNQKIQRVQQEIKNLLQHTILNEVPEVKIKIEQLFEEVNNIKFKNTSPKMLTGEITLVGDIWEMIKESSGYTKWKLDNTEVLTKEEVKDIKEQFNVDFKEKKIERHIFYRSTSDRNSLSTIIVTVLPDLFQVDLHTDRVGYGLDGLVNTKQFKKGIAAESD